MIPKEKALKKAADQCVRREQCASDIKQKLMRWQVSPDTVDEIIEHLKKENFIDEDRYTGFYVKDKFNINGWGKIKIAYMLRKKRIPEKIITKHLQEISEDAYRKKCRELAAQKAADLKYDASDKSKAKLMRFLSSRGFESDLVKQTTDEIEI